MKCTNHPRVEAAAQCAECGKPFCARLHASSSTTGPGAATAFRGSWPQRGTGARVHPGWRKLAAALLSIVPGAGHMFLGLIGKGFALMGLLIVAVFLIILYSDATGHVLDDRLPHPHALRALPELRGLRRHGHRRRAEKRPGACRHRTTRP